ncbi:MAG: hypothetical protein EHM55_18015 [Acidobacteria bacterium]|nr:MAG: hypothetical protein EHM55_18015 [Acidobacteriota bacterium]
MAVSSFVRTRIVIGAVALAFASAPRAAAGQASDPPPATGARVGPLQIDPTIAVSVGLDTNVLNEAEHAKRDYMVRVNPQARVAMRLARATVAATVAAPMHHFRVYTDQDSNGVRGELRLELRLNRFKPYVNEGFVKSSERSGPEIDARVPRVEHILGVGTEVTLSRRFTLTLGAERTVSSFGGNAFYDNVNLSQALDRRGESAAIAVRYAITSLTRLVVTADRVRERFDFQRERNSDSLRVLPGIEFDPAAFIRGKATVGFRRFDVADGRLEDFSGAIASVDLSSTIRDGTLLAASVRRDVAYSYDPIEPYYVVDGIAAAMTQSIAERWRITVQGERQRLSYRGIDFGRPTSFDSAERSTPRVDQLYTLSGGMQYRIRQNLGVGIVVESSRRLSGMVRREYKGTRFLSAVTYGS